MATVVKTKLIETVDAAKMTKKTIEEKIGRNLANPINSKQEGEQFLATLTGEIQITQYGDRKSAHLLTVEGYRVSVPANFDKAVHKAKAQFNCVCMIANITNEQTGKESNIKYTAFA